MRGWISLHRKILDNPILKASKEYSRLEAFIWLLLRANHKEGKCVIGSTLYKVDKGEMITSQTKLMKQFKWSKSKLINFLNLLQDDDMIIVKTEPKLTRITILNYCTYQDSQTNKKPIANQEQSVGKPKKVTNNNVNKDNNVNNLKDRESKFINNVCAEGLKHTPMLEPDIINAFTDYWTEPNKSNTKMKFELQQTFDISRRLKRWVNNDFNSSGKDVSNYQMDSTGRFYLGWCQVCNRSESYADKELNGDSRCCKAKLLPKRRR